MESEDTPGHGGGVQWARGGGARLGSTPYVGRVAGRIVRRVMGADGRRASPLSVSVRIE